MWDPNARNSDGIDNVMILGARGEVETLRAVIGKYRHGVDKEGNTALFYAAHQGTPEMVKFLLAHGANPHHQNKAGWKYWDYQPIKVITYNVCWECVSGMAFGAKVPKGKHGHKIIAIHGELCGSQDAHGVNTCQKNVWSFLAQQTPFDFLALQEAANLVVPFSPQHYICDRWAPHHGEEMLSLWSNKYHLDKKDNLIKGWFKTPSRPFALYFFQGGTAFLNLHPGHDPGFNAIDMFDSALDLSIRNAEAKGWVNAEKIRAKWRTYRIFLAGDFNSPLRDHNLVFYGRQFYGRNTDPSCCDATLQGHSIRTSDHVLSTDSSIRSSSATVKLASDHAPVIGLIDR